MSIPQITNYEAYALSPPTSPFICDIRGRSYLCECRGRYYLLQNLSYDVWHIEEPENLESIVQVLPDLRIEDSPRFLNSEFPLILKKVLMLTKLDFDESKRD